MSENLILVIVGIALIIFGLAKLGSGQSGGFNLSNFGFNIGSKSTQSIRTGNITSEEAKTKKPDWVGLAATAIGFLTALVGLLKG